MQGILAMSHLNKESQALRELCALFDEYAEILYPEYVDAQLGKRSKRRRPTGKKETSIEDSADPDEDFDYDAIDNELIDSENFENDFNEDVLNLKKPKVYDFGEEEEEEEDADIEKAFAAELKLLQNNSGTKIRKSRNPSENSSKEAESSKDSVRSKWFIPHKLGISCNIFIQTFEPIEPTEFVSYILNDLATSKKKKTRFTCGLLPFSLTTQALIPTILRSSHHILKKTFGPNLFKLDTDKILEGVAPSEAILPNTFSKAEVIPVSFKIIPRVRHNDLISKSTLIQAIAAMIPSPHKVDLSEPDVCIMVEVIKGVCGICVLPDYVKFKKYNLESIFEPPQTGELPKVKSENESELTEEQRKLKKLKKQEKFKNAKGMMRRG
ncbi:THUMP domain-containing protein 1 [Nowakowskiella sp. JEL0078]|nr:THUMP domain-containing protein 1 [Nowakowskiella sp. JEL0078]